jgi:hypothetical protein
MIKKLQEKFAGFAESFYCFGSGFTGKLANFFRLAQFSAWLQRRFSKSPFLLGIESFVAIPLTIFYFFLMFPSAAAPRHSDGNEMNAYLFTYLSDYPYSHKDMMSGFDVWRARLPGPMISGAVYNAGLKEWGKINGRSVAQPRQIAFGKYKFEIPMILFSLYQAMWLIPFFAILILHRKDALLIMLGVFCGLMYNFIMPAGQWFYPWDMPAMFFFTWACLLYDKRSFFPLLVIVWLGSLFKETTLCCALLILLGEHWTLKKRIVGFAGTVIAWVLTRKLLMAAYGVHTLVFAGDESKGIHEMISKAWVTVVGNLDLLFSTNLNHILFVNAGSFFIMMLIPWKNRRDVVFKILILAFVFGLMRFGSFAEFRNWYEVLPLGWMLISEALSNRCPVLQEIPVAKNKSERNATADNRTTRIMKGSYWLVMGGLFVLALGAWIVANRN